MPHIRQKIWIVFALALLPWFQNCKLVPGEPSTQSSHLKNSGQPYDGKVYVYQGSGCADGTFVKARILIDGSSGATLLRENCQNVTRLLNSGDYILNADQLIYNSLTFEPEVPAVHLGQLQTWYYQLTGTVPDHPAKIYILDLFETDIAKISSLRAGGKRVICSVSAGTAENYRPDVSEFDSVDLGNQISQGERFVDIRSVNVRRVMVARLDLAKQKGCDGVDFDNVDGFTNNTGFPLTSELQLEYNLFLAFAAHDRKLIMSLNNVPELASSLSLVFDFAIVEECFRYNECDKYLPFTQKNKAVLALEYTSKSPAQCAAARTNLFSLIYLSENLDGSRYESCE